MSLRVILSDAFLFGISWNWEAKGFGIYIGPFLIGIGWGEEEEEDGEY